MIPDVHPITEAKTESNLSPRGSRFVVGLLVLTFASGIVWPRFVTSTSLMNSVFIWTGVILTSMTIAWLKNKRKTPEVSVVIRRPHYIQMLVQLAIFGYWGWYWNPVYEQAPLILSQVVFAYLVEMTVCWFKYGRWRFGFGPWPIVLSTNLFMWFVDAHFWAQYLLIALAYLSREWLRWNRDGKESHIFNPSAFGLCVVSLLLISMEWPHLTHGEEISVTLGYPPYAYHFIFAMGVIVQFFFRVTLVTLSAVLASWVVGTLYFAQTGGYMYVDTTIPIAVFLGMNLLVTDPASSPKSNGGKVLFGTLYGLAIFFMYEVLRDMGRPALGTDPGLSVAWMDKLLFLPFLNLLSRPLDSVGQHLNFSRFGWRWNVERTNLLHLGIWVGSFAILLPGLVSHPGNTDFWEGACEKTVERACENAVILQKVDCENGESQGCSKVAKAHREGQHVPRDLVRSGGYGIRACQLGSESDCLSLFELGFLIRSEDPSETGRGLAQECFVSACKSGDEHGCWAANCQLGQGEFCRQLGDGLRIGQSLDKNLARAALLYEDGCHKKDDLSCTIQGTMLWIGDGIPRDQERGMRLIDGACQRGFQQACLHARRLKGNHQRSRKP